MELLLQAIIVLFVGGLTLLVFKFSSGVNHNTVVGAVKEKKDLIIKLLVVIIVCSVTLFLTNTQIKKVGKNAYINNFEEFVVKVQKNHKEYSSDDWIKIDKEYQKLRKENHIKYEIFFTKEDETRVNTLDGEYLSYKTKGVLDNIYETIKDGVDNAVEYIDGFIKGLNNELGNDTVNE